MVPGRTAAHGDSPHAACFAIVTIVSIIIVVNAYSASPPSPSPPVAILATAYSASTLQASQAPSPPVVVAGAFGTAIAIGHSQRGSQRHPSLWRAASPSRSRSPIAIGHSQRDSQRHLSLSLVASPSRSRSPIAVAIGHSQRRSRRHPSLSRAPHSPSRSRSPIATAAASAPAARTTTKRWRGVVGVHVPTHQMAQAVHVRLAGRTYHLRRSSRIQIQTSVLGSPSDP